MPAIESVSIFRKILSDVLITNTVMCSDDPSFCIRDELVTPGEPTVEYLRITIDDL